MQPELREALEKLRKKGKRLFLATNEHIEYAEAILNISLGGNWQELFDIQIVNC